MSPLHWFLVSAVVVAAVAAWFDFRTGHIPNWVTLGPLCLAPIAHFALQLFRATSSVAVQAAGVSVLGAAVCALVPLMLYRAGAIGGGDVKLLAAMGAIFRPLVGIEAEFYAFLAAALIAPARLAYEGKLMQVLGNTLTLALNPFRPKERRRQITPEMMTSIRFGPAIFLGAFAAAIVNWSAPW
jgi:prepilin peptidase CpaA